VLTYDVDGGMMYLSKGDTIMNDLYNDLNGLDVAEVESFVKTVLTEKFGGEFEVKCTLDEVREKHNIYKLEVNGKFFDFFFDVDLGSATDEEIVEWIVTTL